MKPRSILIISTALLISSALIFQSCKKDNQASTCKITSPENGQEITQGKTVTIIIDANDGDGTIAEVRFFVDNVSVGHATTYPYNYEWNTSNEDAGNHSLKATALDNNGESASDEISVTLIPGGSAPIANFSATPTNGTAPLTVNFTDQSTNTPTSWKWDFGDGGSSTEQNPSHIYYNAGTFTVIFTATNNYGSTKTNNASITVSNGGVGGGPDPDGYFTDARDGQVYSYKIIGSQTWMAENLNCKTSSSWAYDNDPANGDIYGRLYTWDESLNVCPNGWHLPSDEEWTVLTDFLGGENAAGDKMKEAGTAHWDSPFSHATNSSGFTALPGGRHYSNGLFIFLGMDGYWWSSTEYSGTDAMYRKLDCDLHAVYRLADFKTYGFSVRCLKNE